HRSRTVRPVPAGPAAPPYAVACFTQRGVTGSAALHARGIQEGRRRLVPLALAAMLVAAVLGSQAEGRSREAGWCGADRVAPDRLPAAVAGSRVPVVSAAPADGEDRFSASATPIVADLSALDAWWRREDPTRTLRFDLFAFPSCPGGLDVLDLSTVRLPHDSAYYRPIQERQSRLSGDLAPTFSHPARKYVV